ncbi:hypothetical protein PCK2_000893 [Pneumocystis canis]|nr:hypothetical protein PCK2_000893 [Pneumocystis canis]
MILEIQSVMLVVSLYYKLHSVHRPISMKKNSIKRRKRNHVSNKMEMADKNIENITSSLLELSNRPLVSLSHISPGIEETLQKTQSDDKIEKTLNKSELINQESGHLKSSDSVTYSNNTTKLNENHENNKNISQRFINLEMNHQKDEYESSQDSEYLTKLKNSVSSFQTFLPSTKTPEVSKIQSVLGLSPENVGNASSEIQPNMISLTQLLRIEHSQNPEIPPIPQNLKKDTWQYREYIENTKEKVEIYSKELQLMFLNAQKIINECEKKLSSK